MLREKGNHVKLQNIQWDAISHNKELSGEDFSVLLHLVRQLDRDTPIRMTTEEIAEAVEMEGIEVSRVIEKLTGMGILKCIRNDQNQVYVLNPKLDPSALGLNALRYLSTLR